MQQPGPLQRAAAEFVGTFGLVFAGCGAIVIDTTTGGAITHVGVALTFGLIIATMIYATGHISGAHFNPAVTLAFAATRHFPLALVPAYLAAQFGGAIAASVVLRLLFGNVTNLGTTLPAGGIRQSLALETVLTFFLMFVIISVATDTRAVGQAAALAIGGTVGLEAMFAGPISGASMNPARSLAPALISGTWTAQWLYLIGPIIGALLGAFAYQFIRGKHAPAPDPHLDTADHQPIA
ncbi:MAG: MIP family channel protein [Thermomicrobiales bacterium]